MKLIEDNIARTCPESDIYNELLSLDNKRILELGCGRAELTRDIAEQGQGRHILALEVDERQHQLNLKIDDLPNVTFERGAAEAIPAADNSHDIVFMFKSLHHVPQDKLAKAMQEIKRVLVPGGLAYISEPVYAGDFNDLVSLFHDEKQVRQAAFSALKHAVEQEDFVLEREVFFNMTVTFRDFDEFENKVLKVTHSDFKLDQDTYTRVKTGFYQNLSEAGAQFTAPIRVDLLSKPV